MEELCTDSGGYARFFRGLALQHFGWYAAIVAVPVFFLDHHRCESSQPFSAWLLYILVVMAMIVLSVLTELSTVQRLGLLGQNDVQNLLHDARWQLPLLGSVLWKLDTYTDVVFIFIALDCGSSLWWASLATFVFAIAFCQLLLNMCFACTDCDHELPRSFGFVMLDFKFVNAAVRHVMPFDPDASDLPVAKPVTVRTSSHLIAMEKIVGDVAQISIQSVFLGTAQYAHAFVYFSICVGLAHGSLSLVLLIRDCVEEGRAMQSQNLMQNTALRSKGTKDFQQKGSRPPAKPGHLLQGSSTKPYGSCGLLPSVIGRLDNHFDLGSSSHDRYDRSNELDLEKASTFDLDLL